jgi:hypothetical protein
MKLTQEDKWNGVMGGLIALVLILGGAFTYPGLFPGIKKYTKEDFNIGPNHHHPFNPSHHYNPHHFNPHHYNHNGHQNQFKKQFYGDWHFFKWFHNRLVI